MTLKKVRPGDPLRIPARTYNAFVDAADLAARIQADAKRDRAIPAVHEHLVQVRNDSEADLPRFGILGIGDPIIEPDGNSDEFSRRATIIGAAITEEDQYAGRFVIARSPLAQGAIGWAVVRGITPALIEVTDEDHTHADTFPDTQHLQSGFTGAARILWKEADTGLLFALVDLGPRDLDRFPAKLGTASVISGRDWGWLYHWEEVRLDADPLSGTYGKYATAPDGLSSDLVDERRAFNRYESDPSTPHGLLLRDPMPAGMIVEMRAERTLQGDTRFVFDGLHPSELFPVVVTQTGGSAGDDSTQCSWTYEIEDLQGNILADSDVTPLAPGRARAAAGAYAAGSGLGWAYWDRATSSIALWDANEVEEVVTCP